MAISSASVAQASLAFLRTFSSPPEPRSRSNGALPSASGLADHGLDDADGAGQQIAALAELLEAGADALGVVARLVEVALEALAIAPARGHGDLRLQDAHQRELASRGPR